MLERARQCPDSPYVAPRNPVEAMIAEFWAEHLSLDKVGMFDNFLEIGGDSLAAARIISEVRHFFGTQASLALLLENPGVAAFTAKLFEGEAGASRLRAISEALTHAATLSAEEAVEFWQAFQSELANR